MTEPIVSDERKLIASIKECYLNINKVLLTYSKQGNIELGTTMSTIFILNNKYIVAHIGDSRIYKFKKEMCQLTPDHVFWVHKSDGKILYEKSVLTQCIGVSENIDIYFSSGTFEKNEAFVICSDGFYKKMKNKEIIQHIERALSNDDLLKSSFELIGNIKARSEKDNISLGIIKAIESMEEQQ